MPCLCFKKTEVKPFNMDAKVECIVKDLNGKPYWIYLDSIQYDKRNKMYLKYYKFYDPIKIHKVNILDK